MRLTELYTKKLEKIHGSFEKTIENFLKNPWMRGKMSQEYSGFIKDENTFLLSISNYNRLYFKTVELIENADSDAAIAERVDLLLKQLKMATKYVIYELKLDLLIYHNYNYLQLMSELGFVFTDTTVTFNFINIRCLSRYHLYNLCLMSDSADPLVQGKIYIGQENGKLTYSLVALDGNTLKNIKTDIPSPENFTLEELEPLKNTILDVTLKAGHTRLNLRDIITDPLLLNPIVIQYEPLFKDVLDAVVSGFEQQWHFLKSFHSLVDPEFRKKVEDSYADFVMHFENLKNRYDWATRVEMKSPGELARIQQSYLNSISRFNNGASRLGFSFTTLEEAVSKDPSFSEKAPMFLELKKIIVNFQSCDSAAEYRRLQVECCDRHIETLENDIRKRSNAAALFFRRNAEVIHSTTGAAPILKIS